MVILRFILTDQLSMDIATLSGCDKKRDVILMCEVHQEATYVKMANLKEENGILINKIVNRLKKN